MLLGMVNGGCIVDAVFEGCWPEELSASAGGIFVFVDLILHYHKIMCSDPASQREVFEVSSLLLQND